MGDENMYVLTSLSPLLFTNKHSAAAQDIKEWQRVSSSTTTVSLHTHRVSLSSSSSQREEEEEEEEEEEQRRAGDRRVRVVAHWASLPPLSLFVDTRGKIR